MICIDVIEVSQIIIHHSDYPHTGY